MGWVKDNVIDPITGKSQRDAIEQGTQAQIAQGDKAIAAAERSRDIARSDLQPFRQFGQDVTGTLSERLNRPESVFQSADPSTIASDPLFNALFGEAERAITARNAAAGKLGSGDTLRDLTNASMAIGSDIFNQNENRRARDFAINEGVSNQRTQELFNALIQGQNAAAGQGTASLQTGRGISDLLTQIGNVQAAGAIGQANARTGGIENIIGLAQSAAGGKFGGKIQGMF